MDKKTDNIVSDVEMTQKNLTKLSIDYKKMYEETVKSGDLEGAELLKKMIRKLSSKIIGTENDITNCVTTDINDINDVDVIDDVGIVDYIFYDELFIDTDLINEKLSNFDKYNIVDFLDYDNSRINDEKN